MRGYIDYYIVIYTTSIYTATAYGRVNPPFIVSQLAVAVGRGFGMCHSRPERAIARLGLTSEAALSHRITLLACEGSRRQRVHRFHGIDMEQGRPVYTRGG